MVDEYTIDLYKRQIKRYKVIKWIINIIVIILILVIVINSVTANKPDGSLIGVCCFIIFFLIIIKHSVFGTKIRNRKRIIEKYGITSQVHNEIFKEHKTTSNNYSVYEPNLNHIESNDENVDEDDDYDEEVDDYVEEDEELSKD